MDPYHRGGPPPARGPDPRGPGPEAAQHPTQPYPARPPLSTGAKVGIGVAIGCGGAAVVLVLVMLMMGACTCQACASCCADMQQMAEKAREAEQREAAKIHPVGETVHVDSLAVTVSDAQRRQSTVVVTVDIENTAVLDEELSPEQFTVVDGAGRRYAVDREKAEQTIKGVGPGNRVAGEQTVTTRAVFTIPQQARGLILEFETPEPSAHVRRFGLGL